MSGCIISRDARRGYSIHDGDEDARHALFMAMHVSRHNLLLLIRPWISSTWSNRQICLLFVLMTCFNSCKVMWRKRKDFDNVEDSFSLFQSHSPGGKEKLFRMILKMQTCEERETTDRHSGSLNQLQVMQAKTLSIPTSFCPLLLYSRSQWWEQWWIHDRTLGKHLPPFPFCCSWKMIQKRERERCIQVIVWTTRVEAQRQRTEWFVHNKQISRGKLMMKRVALVTESATDNRKLTHDGSCYQKQK